MADAKKPFYRDKKWKLGNSFGWWHIPYCPHCKRQLGLMAEGQKAERCPMCNRPLNCGAHENKHTAVKGGYCWRCGAKMDGVAMEQTIVWCHDCKNFLEYTKEYTQTVDGANGDCHIRLVSGADKQFCACKYDDFCSYGKRKGGDSNEV